MKRTAFYYASFPPPPPASLSLNAGVSAHRCMCVCDNIVAGNQTQPLYLPIVIVGLPPVHMRV